MRSLRIAAFLVAASASSLAAQQPVVAKLVAEPARLTLKAGQSLPLKVTAYDAQGNVVPDASVRLSAPRMALSFGDGQVTARRAGSYTAVATSISGRDFATVTLEIPILVEWPALSKIDIAAEAGRLYVGTMLAHSAKGSHADGTARLGLAVTWRSSDASVATVDRFGNLTALKPGSVTISAEAEGVSA